MKGNDHHFFAYISRMRFINRWALMRNSYTENIQEHSHMTAVLAHALAVIRNQFFDGHVDEGQVAVAALYHDAGEILTGDMPTPVKYKNEALRSAYKAVEQESARLMASLQPEALRGETEEFLTGRVLNDAERKILKAADRLSALIKCLEECQSGNREFEAAREQQLAALHGMDCPEAEYFITHMLPCYTQNLDELTRGRF